MKKFSMDKMLGSIKRKPSSSTNGNSTTPADAGPRPGEKPEQVVHRCIKAFCGVDGALRAGDEVTFLPTIVEAAESSPAAAAEAARLIRKYLHRDYWSNPSAQYNSIMLMRILADNPGPTFTRHVDKKFSEVAKDLLRAGRDPSVRHMMMETLDAFQQDKAEDEGLKALVEMWKKEKEKAIKIYGNNLPQPRTLNAPAFQTHPTMYQQPQPSGRRLPDPVELTNRLEEARTSAKLLQQVVQCTPPQEVMSNDLMREFADRCTSASRSIVGYMQSQNPVPDNDTMESLIDTNEQLQQALSLHQRAVLNARKQLGLNSGTTSPQPAGQPAIGAGAVPGARPPPLPSRDSLNNTRKGKSNEVLPQHGTSSSSAAAGAAAGRSGADAPNPDESENPFRDPQPVSSASSAYKVPAGEGSGGGGGGSSAAAPVVEEQRLAFEPYHPHFDSTPSYLNRQESATDNIHMHGASTGSSAQKSGEAPLAEDRSLGNAYGGASGGAGGSSSAALEDDIYDNDDHDTSRTGGKDKTPMYRY